MKAIYGYSNGDFTGTVTHLAGPDVPDDKQNKKIAAIKAGDYPDGVLSVRQFELCECNRAINVNPKQKHKLKKP